MIVSGTLCSSASSAASLTAVAASREQSTATATALIRLVGTVLCETVAGFLAKTGSIPLRAFVPSSREREPVLMLGGSVGLGEYLCFGEAEDAFLAELAADAALVEAAEHRAFVDRGGVVVVEEDVAGA